MFDALFALIDLRQIFRKTKPTYELNDEQRKRIGDCRGGEGEYGLHQKGDYRMKIGDDIGVRAERNST